MDTPAIAAVERLARQQHGVVTRAQATALGVSSKVQIRLIAHGTWGVHLDCLLIPAAARRGDLTDASALLLRLGGDAAVTGPTALRLQGWTVPDQLLIVHVPGASRARAGVARIVRDDRPRVVRKVRGLRLVAPVEALLDTLVCATDARARALIDQALQLHWVTAGEFECAVFERLGRGRLGASRLRSLQAQVADNAHSEAERLVVDILKVGGVSGWVANWVVRAHDGTPLAELDIAFPDLRIGIEIDGFAAHSGRDQFERDRARQNRLVLDGWLILRFTWRQLVHERAWVVQQIRAAIESRLSASA